MIGPEVGQHYGKSTDRVFSNLPIPPGELLAEELKARRMSQRELADRTGRPKQTISEIINGKKSITHDTALELEKVLGISASFWVNLEALYQLAKARLRETGRAGGPVFPPPPRPGSPSRCPVSAPGRKWRK